MKFDRAVQAILEQSVVAVDPNHFDYSDPYWQTPEGKAERADREQRYNAMIERQKTATSTQSPTRDDNRTVELKPDDPSFNAFLNQVKNAVTSGVNWGNIKKDLTGLFKDKPQPTPTPAPATPATAQQPQQQPEQEQPITPTQVNYNSPGFNMDAIDQAAQAVLQQNPNFNADAISQRFRDNLKANIDTLAGIGMSEAEIQKRIAPEIKKYADQIKDYVNTPQYQKPADQQNVTGRSIQQIYGSQGKAWNPWAGQPSSTSAPAPQPPPPPSTSVSQLNQQFNTSGSTTPQPPPPPSTAQYLPSKPQYIGSTSKENAPEAIQRFMKTGQAF